MSFSIQEMVKNPVSEIPTCYLVDQEPWVPSSPEREHSSGSVIPVVDMSSLFSEETKSFELERFHSICKEWGIFQLVNHGVDYSLVEKLKHEIQEFYKLPLEERLRYKLRDGDFEGYGNNILVSDGQKVDWADRLYIITNPIHRRKSHLFSQLPSTLSVLTTQYVLAIAVTHSLSHKPSTTIRRPPTVVAFLTNQSTAEAFLLRDSLRLRPFIFFSAAHLLSPHCQTKLPIDLQHYPSVVASHLAS